MRLGAALLFTVASCGRIGFDQPAPLPDADPDALAVANQYAEELLTDNPLAYWRFEAPDQGRDWSGNGNDGSLLGAVLPDTGAFGNGLRIGTMGAFVVSSKFLFNDRAPFSLECWLYLPILDSDWHQLFSTDMWDATGRQGYTVEYRNADIVFLRRRDSTEGYAAGWASLTAATWHHIVGTYDGTETRLYLDGVLREATTTDLAMATPTTTVLSISEYVFWVNGIVDECAVYGAALPQARVTAHFAQRTP